MISTGIGLLLIILVMLVIAVILKFALSKLLQVDYSYKKTENLFTAAERSLFGILKQIAGDDVEVFGKVRVADVLAPQKGYSKSYWQRAFNKISGKHFDFVLCNKLDLAIICAIELNDASHKLTSRVARDSFLAKACESANLPLIQILAKKSYNISEIEAYLSGFVKRTTSPAISVRQQDPAKVISQVIATTESLS